MNERDEGSTTGSSSSSETSPTSRCEVPLRGWLCTRAKGHDGPCAARPEAESRLGEKVERAERDHQLARVCDGNDEVEDHYSYDEPTISVSASDLGDLIREVRRLREQVTELQARGTKLIESERAATRELDPVCEAVSEFLFAYHESGEDELVNNAVDKLSDVIAAWTRRKLGLEPR